MTRLEFKKHKENFEVNLFEGKKNSSSCYHNIIDRDPNKIAQILIDLYLHGFPIEKAVIIFNRKIKVQDWLGL